jgi:glycosyltransferase involved in cell wall biosynthesis
VDHTRGLQKFFNVLASIFHLTMTVERDLIDVIVRTRNSEEFLRGCLQSVLDDLPVRRIIVVDNGSTDKTIEIASSFEKVDIYLKPDLNLGQATKYGFSIAETEWVAVIDSDIVLTKGWYKNMRSHMNMSDAVEGCRIDHYRFDVSADCTKSRYGRFGQTLLRREPVLNLELDLPYGEDAAISYSFKKRGMRWKKVQNYFANHYPRIEGYTIRRTGVVLRIEQVYVPKNVQIEEGRIARRYDMISKRQAFNRLMQLPLYAAYRTFKNNFWFCLAYFKII